MFYQPRLIGFLLLEIYEKWTRPVVAVSPSVGLGVTHRVRCAVWRRNTSLVSWMVLGAMAYRITVRNSRLRSHVSSHKRPVTAVIVARWSPTGIRDTVPPTWKPSAGPESQNRAWSSWRVYVHNMYDRRLFRCTRHLRYITTVLVLVKRLWRVP